MTVKDGLLSLAASVTLIGGGLLALPASAMAAAQQDCGHLVVEYHFNSDGVNVRQQPTTKSPSNGQGFRGDVFCQTGPPYSGGEYVSCFDGRGYNVWEPGYVQRTGVHGYVNLCYLS